MKHSIIALRRFCLACVAHMTLILFVVWGGSAFAAPADQASPEVRVNLPGSMRNHTDPLVSYLEKETGAKVAITFVTGNDAIIDAMAKAVVDIVSFGGLEYAQAWGRTGAKPLVHRDNDQNSHTVFITQPQLKINSLKDLKGHSFAFGGATSVSSRVLPEYWMREAKVDSKVIEEAIARMRRRGETGHDNMHKGVALAVANKEVDAGSLNRRFLEDMLRDGEITAQQVRVLWEPPPFTDSTWAVRKDLDPQVAESVTNAFVKLGPKIPEHKAILELLEVKQPFGEKFIRAKDSEYDLVRKAAQADGLME